MGVFGIGSAIGGALGLAASIYGGHKASKAARQANALLDAQQKENRAWYDRRYNEDYTQTAAAQRMLTQSREAMLSRLRGSAGQQAVMGGTTAASAADKASANKAMADAQAAVAAQGQARADAIEGQYRATDQAINNAKVGNLQQKAQNIQAAAGHAAQSFWDMGSSFDMMAKKG